MSWQVQGSEKKARSREIVKLREEIRSTVHDPRVGETFEVFVLKEGKEGTWIGRSRNYQLVIFENEVKAGRFYATEIKSNAGLYLRGEAVDGPL